MIHIQPKTLVKLRDRLQERGQRPSLVLTGIEALERAEHPFEGDDVAIAQFEALFEAMFLMMAADGDVGDVERDVLRGAIRELTTNKLRSATLDEMIEECSQRWIESGQEKRLQAVAEVLADEPIAAEAAFVLAAAIAFADDDIKEEENDLLNAFADLLGIDGERANELLDELEADAEPR